MYRFHAGRVKLVAGRFSAQRAREVSWARLIVEDPWKILPNWQVLGRANPGEVYVRNFGITGTTNARLGLRYRRPGQKSRDPLSTGAFF